MTSAVRIIGGAWRRLQLPIAAVDGLRPSPDRVRETLFNWLGQDCTGWRVLDLFAGTGALGFEAASRGASHVYLVEYNKLAAQQLRAHAQTLLTKGDGLQATPPLLQVQQADVAGWIAKQTQAGDAARFDLILADPPFRSDWMDKVLPQLPRLLKPGGLVYLEWSDCLFDQAPRKGLELGAKALAERMKIKEIDALRYLKAGQVHAHLVGIPAL